MLIKPWMINAVQSQSLPSHPRVQIIEIGEIFQDDPSIAAKVLSRDTECFTMSVITPQAMEKYKSHNDQDDCSVGSLHAAIITLNEFHFVFDRMEKGDQSMVQVVLHIDAFSILSGGAQVSECVDHSSLALLSQHPQVIEALQVHMDPIDESQENSIRPGLLDLLDLVEEDDTVNESVTQEHDIVQEKPKKHQGPFQQLQEEFPEWECVVPEEQQKMADALPGWETAVESQTSSTSSSMEPSSIGETQGPHPDHDQSHSQMEMVIEQGDDDVEIETQTNVMQFDIPSSDDEVDQSQETIKQESNPTMEQDDSPQQKKKESKRVSFHHAIVDSQVDLVQVDTNLELYLQQTNVNSQQQDVNIGNEDEEDEEDDDQYLSPGFSPMIPSSDETTSTTTSTDDKEQVVMDKYGLDLTDDGVGTQVDMDLAINTIIETQEEIIRPPKSKRSKRLGKSGKHSSSTTDTNQSNSNSPRRGKRKRKQDTDEEAEEEEFDIDDMWKQTAEDQDSDDSSLSSASSSSYEDSGDSGDLAALLDSQYVVESQNSQNSANTLASDSEQSKISISSSSPQVERRGEKENRNAMEEMYVEEDLSDEELIADFELVGTQVAQAWGVEKPRARKKRKRKGKWDVASNQDKDETAEEQQKVEYRSGIARLTSMISKAK